MLTKYQAAHLHYDAMVQLESGIVMLWYTCNVWYTLQNNHHKRRKAALRRKLRRVKKRQSQQHHTSNRIQMISPPTCQPAMSQQACTGHTPAPVCCHKHSSTRTCPPAARHCRTHPHHRTQQQLQHCRLALSCCCRHAAPLKWHSA